MGEVSHLQLMIVLGIIFAVAVFGLVFIGWMVRDVSRITRAVRALVVQETRKLRRD
jgi:hypothetical protein